jgi:hypothetical protein
MRGGHWTQHCPEGMNRFCQGSVPLVITDKAQCLGPCSHICTGVLQKLGSSRHCLVTYRRCVHLYCIQLLLRDPKVRPLLFLSWFRPASSLSSQRCNSFSSSDITPLPSQCFHTQGITLLSVTVTRYPRLGNVSRRMVCLANSFGGWKSKIRWSHQLGPW